MSQPKIYVPRCYAKARNTPFGEVITLDFDAQALIDFVKANKNARGYIKFDVSPRKKQDAKSTHSVSLNSWTPNGQAARPASDQPKQEEDGFGAPKESKSDDGKPVPF